MNPKKEEKDVKFCEKTFQNNQGDENFIEDHFDKENNSKEKEINPKKEEKDVKFQEQTFQKNQGR